MQSREAKQEQPTIEELQSKIDELTKQLDNARQLAWDRAVAQKAIVDNDEKNQALTQSLQKLQLELTLEAETNRKLKETNKKLNSELKIALSSKRSAVKELKKETSDLRGRLSYQTSTLSQEKQKNEKLIKELEAANINSKKTPYWKYILGGALFVAGVLLTMTGVGAAAGIPLQVLGYIAFSAGTAIMVSEFLYGVYKGIKACLPSKTIDTLDSPEPPSPPSSNIAFGSPAIMRRSLAAQSDNFSFGEEEKPLTRKRRKEYQEFDASNPFSFNVEKESFPALTLPDSPGLPPRHLGQRRR